MPFDGVGGGLWFRFGARGVVDPELAVAIATDEGRGGEVGAETLLLKVVSLVSADARQLEHQ